VRPIDQAGGGSGIIASRLSPSLGKPGILPPSEASMR